MKGFVKCGNPTTLCTIEQGGFEMELFPLFHSGIFQFYCNNEQALSGFNRMKRLNDANTWISKANNLFKFIKFSIDLSVDNLDKCENVFTPYRVTDEYKIVFYYNENAIFRLFMAWDVLGHMYNHFYDLGIKLNSVYYTKIFNKTDCDFMDNKLNSVIGYSEPINFVKNEYTLIREYLNESYKYEHGMTKGHHQYLKKLHDMSMHRDDPHSFTILNSSDRGLPLVDAPQYELMNIVEDAFILYQYITNLIKLYYFEFKSYGFDIGEI